jgi:hypothetical protein
MGIKQLRNCGIEKSTTFNAGPLTFATMERKQRRDENEEETLGRNMRHPPPHKENAISSGKSTWGGEAT